MTDSKRAAMADAIQALTFWRQLKEVAEKGTTTHAGTSSGLYSQVQNALSTAANIAEVAVTKFNETQ
jgi:hypothetical protein